MLTFRMSECVSPQQIVDILWAARLANFFSATLYESALKLLDPLQGSGASNSRFHLNHIILLARSVSLSPIQSNQSNCPNNI